MNEGIARGTIAHPTMLAGFVASGFSVFTGNIGHTIDTTTPFWPWISHTLGSMVL